MVHAHTVSSGDLKIFLFRSLLSTSLVADSSPYAPAPARVQLAQFTRGAELNEAPRAHTPTPTPAATIPREAAHPRGQAGTQGGRTRP